MWGGYINEVQLYFCSSPSLPLSFCFTITDCPLSTWEMSFAMDSCCRCAVALFRLLTPPVTHVCPQHSEARLPVIVTVHTTVCFQVSCGSRRRRDLSSGDENARDSESRVTVSRKLIWYTDTDSSRGETTPHVFVIVHSFCHWLNFRSRPHDT